MVKENIIIILDRIQKEELSLAQSGLSVSKEQEYSRYKVFISCKFV